jgi:hypothetical protein
VSEALLADRESAIQKQWHQQISAQRRRGRDRLPRSVAGLTYSAAGTIRNGLIEIERLTLIVFYDEDVAPWPPAIRVAGVSGRRVPWGVEFNVPRFYKDLSRQPDDVGFGTRLAWRQTDLLHRALKLDELVEFHSRFKSAELPATPYLPALWAGFRRLECGHALASGPEWEAARTASTAAPDELLSQTLRRHRGMDLLPLPWVSAAWEQFIGVFADLRTFPRRQVFAPQAVPADLRGNDGAMQFDFTTPEFRKRPTDAGARGR